MRRSATAVKHQLRKFFAARPEVLAAYLFGSTASGRTHPGSDIDIGLLIDRQRIRRSSLQYRLRIMADLGSALGRSDVDVVLMDDAPPALAQNIIAKGILVSERSHSARVAFQVRALNFFMDTEPMRRQYLSHLKRRYLRGPIGG
jgi:predicted nucleotidyltransferase